MTALNPQATSLNDQIVSANPAILAMLSKRGKGIFFPSKGIIAQSADAKGKEINATIGIALEEDGRPMAFPMLDDWIQKDRKAIFPYAPSSGNADLRALWKERMVVKNPSLQGKLVSQPVVTAALTQGLAMCGYLFLDEGDTVVSPDYYWGNYNLIFKNGYGANIDTFNTFKDGGLDLGAMREVLQNHTSQKLVVLLNFPNNPTGYTPTESEAAEIKNILVDIADSGKQVVVITDDAYFGLVFEEGIIKESIFASLADAHENLLAVKVDGATKEDYAWGLRVGFITFGIRGATESLYKVLEQKLSGAVRGSISNTPQISQSLLLDLYRHPEYPKAKAEKYDILNKRYQKVDQILKDHPEYKEQFEALPFNSGYFMCVGLQNAEAETVRKILLDKYSVGLIAQGKLIRIAFSSTPSDQLEELFARLYKACQDAG